jgi:prepilin signal peptidase PulO-like enzyme (type II secretory pathway)
MITFLALLRSPSWEALSSPQRRFVCRHCVHPLLTRSPVVVAKTVLLILSIIVAYQIGAFDGVMRSSVTMFVVIIIFPELLDLGLVARHRGDIEAYIHGHGSEIQSLV